MVAASRCGRQHSRTLRGCRCVPAAAGRPAISDRLRSGRRRRDKRRNGRRCVRATRAGQGSHRTIEAHVRRAKGCCLGARQVVFALRAPWSFGCRLSGGAC